MTKNVNMAEKHAARRVQNVLGIPYTVALRKTRQAKTKGLNWNQAADAVLAEAHKGQERIEFP